MDGECRWQAGFIFLWVGVNVSPFGQNRIQTVDCRPLPHFRQPELNRLRFRTGSRLHQSEKGFGCGNIGEVAFAVGVEQFQSVTIRHRLTPLLAEPLFQFIPVFTRRLVIWLLGQHLNDVHHREPPCFIGFVVHPADCVVLEKGVLNRHGSAPYSSPVKAWSSRDFFSSSSAASF